MSVSQQNQHSLPNSWSWTQNATQRVQPQALTVTGHAPLFFSADSMRRQRIVKGMDSGTNNNSTSNHSCWDFSHPVQISRPKRVFPKRPAKLNICGTSKIPFSGTYMDDEKATFHSISAMPAFTDKSFEELRMEDYEQRPGGFEKGTNASCEGASTLPNEESKESKMMDFEILMDDEEVAISLTTNFMAGVAAELEKEEWAPLLVFIKLNWESLGNQLARFFLRRQRLKNSGIIPQISLGYHFTTDSNLPQIRKTGLQTTADREKAGIYASFYAAALGDGVYTGNSPTDFYEFRPGAYWGCMILRLLGVAVTSDDKHPAVDTVWGRNRKGHDILNLRHSDQSVVLLDYDGRHVVASNEANSQLLRLQHFFEELLDRVLADEPEVKHIVTVQAASPKRTVLVKNLALYRNLWQRSRDRKFSTIYIAPQTLSAFGKHDSLSTEILRDEVALDQECSICMENLHGAAAIRKLKVCGHVFHESCIDYMAEKCSACPLCRAHFRSPRGTSPSGKLTIVFDPSLTCAGFSPGTIQLYYDMFFGCQKSYNEDRTKCYRSTDRNAYVPDTKEGRQLLQRLVYAFLHGLTFTVGSSLTSGKPNSIIWASIHHKTNLDAHVHGFPDPSYFLNCNAELDALGVPEAGSRALYLPQVEDLNRFIDGTELF